MPEPKPATDEFVEAIVRISIALLTRDGKRYEPIEFRVPKVNEIIVAENGSIIFAGDMTGPRIILREAWSWPPTLGGWGFACDSNLGRIFWFEKEPGKNCVGDWYNKGGGYCRLFEEIQSTRTDLPTAPPLKPGECLRNPNLGGNGK